MFSTLAFAAVLFAPTAAQPAEADAPDRLITSQGVELRSDERVFVLFAALNALGYSEETQRKGPPLRAPVFHAIRLEVRDALRKLDDSKLSGIRTMFEQNPGEIETYLEAILATGSGDKNMSADAKKVAASLDALDQFRQKAELAKLFDTIAAEQRTVAKDLKVKIEKDINEAQRLLQSGEIRAPLSLVVVPNPLDGHDAVRVVDTKEKTYIVTGPGFPQAERAVLEAVLQSAIKKPLDAAWASGGGQKYAKAWDAVKSTPRARRYGDGKAYLGATLAKIVAFKVRAKLDGKTSKDAEDDFADEIANRDGLKWAKLALHALDGWEGNEPFEAALTKGLARSAP